MIGTFNAEQLVERYKRYCTFIRRKEYLAKCETERKQRIIAEARRAKAEKLARTLSLALSTKRLIRKALQHAVLLAKRTTAQERKRQRLAQMLATIPEASPGRNIPVEIPEGSHSSGFRKEIEVYCEQMVNAALQSHWWAIARAYELNGSMRRYPGSYAN